MTNTKTEPAFFAPEVETSPIIGHPRKFCIVEDSRDARHNIKDMLEDTGEYMCVGSFSASEGNFDLIPVLNPDFVLVRDSGNDTGKPGCVAELRSLSDSMRIILMADTIKLAALNQSLEAGCDGYLVRPSSGEQCQEAVKLALARPPRRSSRSGRN